jgi:uncharacterized membrane protein YfcA
MNFLIPFFILSLAAEIIGTVGGFGSSVFFVPIGNYYFDFQTVLGITAVFHLASNVSKITLFKKGFKKELILTLGIPAVLFVTAGAFLSKYIDKAILELSLCIFLIVLSLIFIIWKQIVIKPSKKNAIFGGSLSGFVAGLLGTGGAIRGITMAAFNLEKDVFVATSAVIDLGVDLSRTVVYFFNGFIHYHDLYLIPPLIVISYIGTYFGSKILNTMSQQWFKFVSLIMILAIGILGLMNYIGMFN